MDSTVEQRSFLKKAILVLTALELIALVAAYHLSKPVELPRLYERYLAATRETVQRDIRASISKCSPEELDALLVREVSGADSRRAAEAYKLGLQEMRRPDYAPDSLIRVMRTAGREEIPDHGTNIGGPDRWNQMLGDWDQVYSIFWDAVERASPGAKRSLLDDLMVGKVGDDEKTMIAIAVGRSADSDMIVAMHRHLMSAADPINAWYVLTAFAARTDLPLTHDETQWPVYRRHLKNLLDPVSKEVRWWAAVALARELPDLERFSNLDKGCGVLPPPSVPVEALLPEVIAPKGVPWPMSDEAALDWERRLKNAWPIEDSYAIALLLHWRRSGRQTLPYYPFEVEDAGKRGIRISWEDHFSRPRLREQAQQILDPNHIPTDVSWACVVVGTGPRTEPAHLIASKSGRGLVKCTLRADLPGSSEGTPFRLGVRADPAGPSRDRHESTLTVVVEARLERQLDGGYSFEGSHHSGLGRGSGGGSMQGYARPGEAAILDIESGGGSSSSGVTDAEQQQTAFTLLIPEIGPDARLDIEWRRAVVRFLSRWADAPEDALRSDSFGNRAFWDHYLGQMLQLTSWMPVDDALAPLQRLWNRREFLKGKRHFRDDDPTNAERVGASLLMAGDEAPLAEPDLVAKIPDSVALRIFIYTPNPKVRLAMEAQAAHALTDPIAADLALRLRARGDTNSKVASAARSAESKHVWESIPECTPFLLIVTGLLVAAWLPRAPGNREATAASLVAVGLVFQFVTLEVHGRIWIPLAGDLCFLAAATMERRRAIQALAGLMGVAGLVSFVAPEMTWAGTAGRFLLSAYLAWLSLRQMSQPTRGFFESVAHIATWLLMIVPLIVGSLSDVFTTADSETPILIHVKGAWAWLYVAAMYLAPLVIVHSWRRRALPRPEPPPPTPEYPEGATS